MCDDGTPQARASAIGDATIAPFVRPEQLSRNGRDLLPHYDAGTAYQHNEPIQLLPSSQVGKITPTPFAVEMTPGPTSNAMNCATPDWRRGATTWN